MLSRKFHSLYGELVDELDRYSDARVRNLPAAAIRSRTRLNALRHQLAIERADQII